MRFLMCLCAVAVAGALLMVPVRASEVFVDESEFEFLPSPSPDQEDLFPSSSPDGFLSDDFGESDSWSDPSPTVSPEVIVDQYFGDDGDSEVFPTSSPYFDVGSDDDVELMSNYDAYYGTISTTYLEYMRGYLPKLGFSDHYVAARVSQYNYIFAYGESLSWTGSAFTGSDILVITWNTQNSGTFSWSTQGSFNLYPGSYLVYSDLTSFYPSLADSAGFTSRQILILLTVAFLCMSMIHMYQVRKIRRVH